MKKVALGVLLALSLTGCAAKSARVASNCPLAGTDACPLKSADCCKGATAAK